MDSRTPKRIAGHDIESVIGRGGMGIVYKARSPAGDVVALKTMARELMAGDDTDTFVARFQREAEIGQRLDHPGIVRVMDSGEDAGQLYITMELVEGRTLGELAPVGTRPPIADTISWLCAVLSALNHAHAAGVIHRDIKPSNVILSDAGEIKVMDFGIAHVPGSEITGSIDFLGSPAYMAPEQITGDPIDARTDLFAVGTVLYRFLSGKAPFDGSLAEVLYGVAHKEPPPPSSVTSDCPRLFDTIALRTLAKKPDDRYQTALSLAASLRAAADSLAEAQAADAEATVLMRRSEMPPPAAPPRREVIAALARALEACLSDGVGEKHLGDVADRLALIDKAGDDLDSVAALIHDRLLPALVERAERAMPAPDATPEAIPGTWAATVRLIAVLADAAEPLGVGPAAEAARARVADAVIDVFDDYGQRQQKLLTDIDDPDIARLSVDLLRLDVLREALDGLGAEDVRRRAVAAQRRFATRLMARVNGIIGRFTEMRDALSRFGVANLLLEVEELVVIAERLVGDTELDVSGDGAHIAIDVVETFLDQAGQLAEIVVDELIGDVARPGADARQFDGRLRQLGLIYLFATRLRAERTVHGKRALVDRVHAALARLADRIKAVLTDGLSASASGSDDRTRRLQAVTRLAVAQLTSVFDLAERFGWIELRRSLLSDLRGQLIGSAEFSAMLE